MKGPVLVFYTIVISDVGPTSSDSSSASRRRGNIRIAVFIRASAPGLVNFDIDKQMVNQIKDSHTRVRQDRPPLFDILISD
jgi:hypothetical protein